jgi:hypothetical protein
MFMMSHASDLEAASSRARLRWAEEIDGLLRHRDRDADSIAALERARTVLADLDVGLSHDDLRQITAVIREMKAP